MTTCSHLAGDSVNEALPPVSITHSIVFGIYFAMLTIVKTYCDKSVLLYVNLHAESIYTKHIVRAALEMSHFHTLSALARH